MTMTLDRAELLRVCMLVRPALAVGAYIPAYQHIQFKAGYATTYNDVMALSVRCKTSFERCVAGEMLTKALGSFHTKEVTGVFDEAKNALVLSSARSKLKLPSLPYEDFPFLMPQDEAPMVALPPLTLDAIEKCLRFVGKDDAHPARMGVTLQADGSVFSTDGVTITTVFSDHELALPAGVPVILPTHFCEQLVKLSKATNCLPELFFLSGALLAEFAPPSGNAEAIVYTKTLVDVEPLDFERILQKLGDVPKGMPVPDVLDGAIDRALMVLAAEQDKVLTMAVEEGLLSLGASGAGGESDDEMAVEDRKLSAKCKVDPVLLARGLKNATRIAFVKKAVVLMDEAGMAHYVSHVVE